MNTETRPAIEPATSISPAAALGYVHLTVANLERQIAFYQNVLGFKPPRISAGDCSAVRAALPERPDGSRRLEDHLPLGIQGVDSDVLRIAYCVSRGQYAIRNTDEAPRNPNEPEPFV